MFVVLHEQLAVAANMFEQTFINQFVQRGSTMKRTLLLVCLFFSISTMAVAQIEKGEELQRLEEYFVGEWTFTGESNWDNGSIPHNSKFVCKMVMGGTWMEFEVLDDYDGRFHVYHKGLVTWDAEQGAYVFPHVTSNSPHVLTALGRWIDENTFEFDTGDFKWPDGNTYRFLMRYKRNAVDVLHFTMRQQQNGGEFFLRIEGDYRRINS